MASFWKKFIAGFVIGVGGIIPGFSGGILAVSMGLYKPAVDAITGFFKAPRKNFRFLFPLGLGGVIGFVVFMFMRVRGTGRGLAPRAAARMQRAGV